VAAEETKTNSTQFKNVRLLAVSLLMAVHCPQKWANAELENKPGSSIPLLENVKSSSMVAAMETRTTLVIKTVANQHARGLVDQRSQLTTTPFLSHQTTEECL
jgi:hypothetical protein